MLIKSESGEDEPHNEQHHHDDTAIEGNGDKD